MDIKAEHQGIYKGYGFVLDNGNFTKYKGNAKLFDYQTVIYKNGFFGVLAPGIAYIDVDIREQAEFLYKVIQEMGLKCKVLETTKGKHFIFKDPNGYLNKTITRQYLACGIVADSKSGNANGVEYLKKVGETAERQIIYGKELSISELDELPTFLKPFKSLGEFDENINKDTGEIEPPIALFNDLGEGSRNDTLTRHILALQNVGFTDRDEIRDIIRVINSYFFTDPLEDTELEIILRDDTFIKGEKENQKHCFYDEKGKFLHNIFGDFIINKYEIILYEEELYYFDKGINKYLSLESVEKLERLFINEIDSLKKNIRLEIRGYIRLKAPIKQTPSYNLIPFRNGIYDLKNEKLIPPNKEYVFLNVIPWNYNPKCKKSEFIEDYLNSLTCNNANLKKVLLEFIGFCFYRDNSLRKAIFITGGKYNGKSKFYALLESLLGSDNVVMSMSLERLNGRFDTANIQNKLLTVCDDVDGNYIKDTSILKKIITGDAITAEEKGKKAKSFKYYGKLTMSANEMPRFNDKTGALASRFTITPFKNKFEPGSENCDPLIEEKFNNAENIEYLIILALEELKKVLKRKGFTSTEETKELLKEFKRDNNPILEFIEEYKELKGETFYLEYPIIELYRMYESHCITNGKTYSNINVFGRYMKGELELKDIAKKIAGNVIKFYTQR